MRVICTIFFTFSSFFAFSQIYTFDYFVKLNRKSTVHGEHREVEQSYIYNSTSGLSLNLEKTRQAFTSSLFDKERNIRHEFIVEERNGDLNFKYVESFQFGNDLPTDSKKKAKKIKITKLDSLTYKIKIPPTKNGLVTNLTSIVRFEKSDDNLIILPGDYYFEKNLMNAISEIMQTLPYKVVNKESSFDRVDVFHKTKIIELKKINLTLEMPSQLIWKETPKVPKNPSFKVNVTK